MNIMETFQKTNIRKNTAIVLVSIAFTATVFGTYTHVSAWVTFIIGFAFLTLLDYIDL